VQSLAGMLGFMSSARTLPRQGANKKPSSKRRKKSKPAWTIWWPLLLGIAVTPLARRAADVLAMEGPGALRMLYPWVALLKLRLLGLTEDAGNSLSQILMYLQFPLYGLFMSILLRFRGAPASLLCTALLHLIPLLLLIALAHG